MRAQNAVLTLARVELEWHVVRIETVCAMRDKGRKRIVSH
jgi:hypothetical protein